MTYQSHEISALILDDDPDIRRLFERQLSGVQISSETYRHQWIISKVLLAPSIAIAREIALSLPKHPQLLLCDRTLEGETGETFIEEAAEWSPVPPATIFMTADSFQQVLPFLLRMSEQHAHHPFLYHPKPVRIDELKSTIQMVLELAINA